MAKTLASLLVTAPARLLKSASRRKPIDVAFGVTDVNHPFAGLIIRSVITCYAVWSGVTIYDLAACESKRPGQCEPQRAELRGAMTTIPGTLLAWLADSPFSGKTQEKPANTQPITATRRSRQSSEEG